MKKLVECVRGGGELCPEEVREAVEGLVSGAVGLGEKADFLLALHERGEMPSEVASFVLALLDKAEQPQIEGESRPLLDVCGTGGDKAGFFNVSTAVMFVVAAAGVRVVKHGNRGITSKSGGADVLESLGVPIRVAPADAGDFLQEHGFVFLFAPDYHPAFREIAPVRKLLAEKGKTTIFNILGPLLNPARPDFQIAGVFQKALLPVYAEVFRILGRAGAWAVHGEVEGGGLDEISLHGKTEVVRLAGGGLDSFVIDGMRMGLEGSELGRVQELRGGSPGENAEILRGVLRGKDRGARRSLVVLNAGAALSVCGVAGSLEQGIAVAQEAIDSGKTGEIIDAFC